MSARDELRDCFLSDSRGRFEAAADKYRAEVLAEAHAEVVALRAERDTWKRRAEVNQQIRLGNYEAAERARRAESQSRALADERGVEIQRLRRELKTAEEAIEGLDDDGLRQRHADLMAEVRRQQKAWDRQRERMAADLTAVVEEIARFGIYGAAPVATKALVRRADELVTENAELKALTSACGCGTPGLDFDGPKADCPVHGAIRGLQEARAEEARLREFERRVTEELEEFEDAAKGDPNTPRVARLMIAALQHAVRGS